MDLVDLSGEELTDDELADPEIEQAFSLAELHTDILRLALCGLL